MERRDGVKTVARTSLLPLFPPNVTLSPFSVTEPTLCWCNNFKVGNNGSAMLRRMRCSRCRPAEGTLSDYIGNYHGGCLWLLSYVFAVPIPAAASFSDDA